VPTTPPKNEVWVGILIFGVGVGGALLYLGKGWRRGLALFWGWKGPDCD